MASNRCFNSFNEIVPASVLSAEKRNKTIYGELLNNVEKLHTANPVKKNGYKYNQNSIVNPSCDISGGYVDVAINYEIRSAIKNGADAVYPKTTATPKYESWCGNLYSVNYDSHQVNSVVKADASFNNIVVDPSYLLFYNECDIVYENINKPEQWTFAVDLSFQGTYFSKTANGIIYTC